MDQIRGGTWCIQTQIRLYGSDTGFAWIRFVVSMSSINLKNGFETKPDTKTNVECFVIIR